MCMYMYNAACKKQKKDMTAANKQKKDVIELDRRYTQNYRALPGLTPLHLAAMKGHASVCRVLLGHPEINHLASVRVGAKTIEKVTEVAAAGDAIAVQRDFDIF